MVGQTPVLRITAPFTSEERGGFWAKLEGFNPGGMKDRPALHMVERAAPAGGHLPPARIVESTSGTLGLGLALAGTVYGHPVTLVTDPGMEPIIQNMLAAFGADIELVTEPHPQGGWQQARRDRVQKILATDRAPGIPINTATPDNVEAYRGLALELNEQLGAVDVLVCSVGTGGHSAGVARVLREFNPQLRLIGVDTVGSTIFGQPAASRLMRGLGSSIYPGNVDYQAFNEVHWVAPPRSRCGHAAPWRPPTTPVAAGASVRSPWLQAGSHAIALPEPRSQRSSRTVRNATSTPSTTTTTAAPTACSTQRSHGIPPPLRTR